MAKKQNQLLDMVGNYLERLQVLLNHTEKNYLLANKDNSPSVLDLIPLGNLEHWDFLKKETQAAFMANNYDLALEMTAMALLHLHNKTKWTFAEDDTRAFSNSAQLHHFGIKLPIAATFFADGAKSAQKAGMAKTESRLNEVDDWLSDLERHYNVNLRKQVSNAVDNAENALLEMAEETYNKVVNFF